MMGGALKRLKLSQSESSGLCSMKTEGLGKRGCRTEPKLGTILKLVVLLVRPVLL